ncbi:MAG TPA: hypothetical protein VEW72_08035 [Burkholderiales bacterium]|nr:hypothetical protein [Burkholderiales bacterium]
MKALRQVENLTVSFLIAYCTLACAPVLAEDVIPDNPALKDKFFIGIGGYLPTSSTDVRLDSATLGVGANLNMEDTLGLDERKLTPEFLARWRFTERWRMEMEYFQLDRSGTRTLSGAIQIGDKVYSANEDLQSEFNIAVTRISVGYSFFKTADKELGIGIGMHVAEIETRFNGSLVGEEGSDATAPLPVLSLYSQFALTDKWSVGARFDRFALEVNPYRGDITSVGLDLQYQAFRHIGFGIGFRTLDIELEAEEGDFRGKIESRFSGPIFYMNASF